MNAFFEELSGRDAVWLNDEGPSCDIVISTRASVARNLPTFPFPHNATDIELATILTDLVRRVRRLPAFAGGWDLDFPALQTGQRQILQEKLLASHRLLGRPEHRGLVLSRDLSQVVMINEEDHLSLQSFRPGFDPFGALADVMSLDEELEQEVEAAFDQEWGYLTASPTNLGTGLHLSGLIHLPGLVMVGEIEKVLNALRQLQFSVQGLYGEAHAVRGSLFRISNLITLGRDEQEITSDFNIHVGKIISYERSARDQLYQRDPLGIEDMVQRSRSILASARLITAQETFDCLSNVRLGVGLGLLPVPAPGELNRLTILQQTAHLEHSAGQALSGREKGAARAALLREFFAVD